MANKVREKAKRFLSPKEKKKFFKEVQMLIINIDHKKRAIGEKVLEIANAKRLIEQNNQDIIRLESLQKEFEQELYESHKRISVLKDGSKEIKLYYE